jgi:predicted transcriptional regulator
MVTHMKTTIEIADDLLVRAKQQARKERKTLRSLIDEALRQRLGRTSARPRFQLRRHPFRGSGLQPGIAEGRWDALRDLIYRLG